MNWLYLVIAGHLINALAFVLTKFILDKHVKNANVLAIIVGLLGLAAFLLFPFGLILPTGPELLLDLFAGAVLIGALLAFNYALKKYEVSRVVPISGGAVPIFTWLLSFVLLGERLLMFEIISFVFLLVGTIVLANDGNKKSIFSWKMAMSSLFAGFLFALSFVLTKYAFEFQDFINGFVWVRLGSFLVAIILLMKAANRHDSWAFVKKTSWLVKGIFGGSLLLGGIGFSLLNYSISIGSVTLVNALQGVQYSLLLIVVLLSSKFTPKLIKEKYSVEILIQKIAGIVLISLGIILLAIC